MSTGAQDGDALDRATGSTDDRQEAGDVPASPVSADPAPADPHAYARDVAKRLQRDGLWKGQAEFTRNDLMRSSKGKFKNDAERQAWVYSELDKMYPPVQVETRITAVDTKGLTTEFPLQSGISGGDSGQIQGLTELPEAWGELPASVSLAAEIGWVQANRLRVVLEQSGRATRVKLEQALSPAPSWAALSWLETSIRSYAKFLDAAVKVSGSSEDEGAVMRAERKSVEEIRALLKAMEEADGVCPSCGRPH